DMVFWSILGVGLVANTLYEARFGRNRTLGRVSWSGPSAVRRVLGVAATFVLMCVLWSLWNSPSLAAWASLWSVSGFDPARTQRLIVVTLIGAVVVGGVIWATRLVTRLISEPGRG